MQKYVARNARNVTDTRIHLRNSKSRSTSSERYQPAARAMKIQIKGNAYGPLARKINIAIAVKTTRPKAVVATVADRGAIRSASAAQIAKTKWKKGSQRKLHRKRPAVGIMHSKSTSKSKTSSHLICFKSIRPRQRKPAISAAGVTSPHANSVA